MGLSCERPSCAKSEGSNRRSESGNSRLIQFQQTILVLRIVSISLVSDFTAHVIKIDE